MIHILQSCLRLPHATNVAIAMYNAIQKQKFDVAIEDFSKCKQNIYKWINDIVIVLDSQDNHELDSIVSHLLVTSKLTIYFVSTDCQLSFRDLSERTIDLMLSKQKLNHNMHFAVPATRYIGAYMWRIFPRQIAIAMSNIAITMHLHSLVNFDNKFMADFAKLSSYAGPVILQVDKNYTRFGILPSQIEASVRHKSLPIIDGKTTSIYDVHSILHTSKFANASEIAATYSNRQDLYATTLKNCIAEYDKDLRKFELELHRICTINL